MSSDFRSFERQVSLERVLELHDQSTHPLALADNLGDAFLLHANVVQATVRALSQRAGLRFTTTPSYDYAVVPLICLDDICATATIPYDDNVAPLRRMAARYPGRFQFVHAITTMARRNVLLHECVHALSRRELATLPPARSFSEVQTLICDRLMEEATANATECLSRAIVRTREEALFARRALYVEDVVSVGLLDAMGPRDLFRLMFLGFLTSNFLVTWMRKKMIYRLLETAVAERALRRSTRRDIVATFRRCLELPIGFRLRTNEVTLRTLGVRETIFEALDFDFAPELTDGGRIATYLARVSEWIVDDRAQR